jgi:transmembrane sensor
VEFTDTPLSEAIALFNRENQLSLSLADETTAKLRITGVFWTDDPEGFARLLDSSLGIKSRSSPGHIVLGK